MGRVNMGGGTKDYSKLENKPAINGHELSKETNSSELEIKPEDIAFEDTETLQDKAGNGTFTPLYIEITITTDKWEDFEGKKRANIESSKISEDCIVDVKMDLENKAKMSNGNTSSYNGGVYLITEEAPTEDVQMCLEIKKAIKTTL